MKIKILHIIKTLNLGGAETNLLNLLDAFDKDKFEMHVGYSFGGELERKFIDAGAKLFKYDERINRVQSLASIGIILRIRAYLLKNRIDIIHTHNFSGHVWGALAAKLAGKKIVEHVHDFRYFAPDDFARRRGFNKQFRFIKFFKNVSDKVIVLTGQNVDFLLSRKFYPASKVVELQNGIPMTSLSVTPDERITITARLGIRTDARIILTPVRVAPEKNVDLVLKVAPMVARQHPRAVFAIAGDGPLLKEYQDHVRARGMDYIQFIGYHADIRRLLAVSDIMFLPSLLELHSIAILEAMSMKVPVVVSEGVGCNSEFIQDGVNGVLRDPFREEGWAEPISRLLSDEPYRLSVAEAGYGTCLEKFDITKTIKAFERIYEDLTCH